MTKRTFHGSLALVLTAACSSSTSNPYATPTPTPTSTGTPTPTPTSTATGTPDAGPPPSGGKKAYVGLFGDKAVAVLDMTTQKVLSTLPVTAPDGLVISPDGKKVFVSSTDSGTVKVIDTATDTQIQSIDVGAKPGGLDITPDGAHLVVSVAGANVAAVVDTTTYQIERTSPVPLAHSSCLSPNGAVAFVGSQDTTAPAVILVAVATDAQPIVIPVDKSPRALSFFAPDKIYFSAVGFDGLEILDPVSGTVTGTVPTGGSPHDNRPTKDGKLELTISQTVGDLEFIDPATDAVVGAVPTGKMPHWIGLTPDGTQAWVTNEGDNNIVVVDLATQKSVATIPVGNAPRKIALQP